MEEEVEWQKNPRLGRKSNAMRGQISKDESKDEFDVPIKCSLVNCELCSKGNKFGAFHMTLRGWKDRLVEVMTILQKSTGRDWLSLPNEILPFIESHWKILWPPYKRKGGSKENRDWKRKVCEALSRNKHCFQSSQSNCGRKGFWKLRTPDDRETGDESLAISIASNSTQPQNKIPPSPTNSTTSANAGSDVLSKYSSFDSRRESFTICQAEIVKLEDLEKSKMEFVNQIRRSPSPIYAHVNIPSISSVNMPSIQAANSASTVLRGLNIGKADNSLSNDFCKFLERNGIKSCNQIDSSQPSIS